MKDSLFYIFLWIYGCKFPVRCYSICDKYSIKSVTGAFVLETETFGCRKHLLFFGLFLLQSVGRVLSKIVLVASCKVGWRTESYFICYFSDGHIRCFQELCSLVQPCYPKQFVRRIAGKSLCLSVHSVPGRTSFR